MKATVDQDACVGCGLCPDVCPAVFEMQGDTAVAKTNPVPPGEEDACREAADGCPVDAIAIEE